MFFMNSINLNYAAVLSKRAPARLFFRFLTGFPLFRVEKQTGTAQNRSAPACQPA